ncbi:hypothetical protein ACT16_09495 [Mycobacterium heckeshornense]|nr:hypothetical protein ACT16_09495 [Mycobacterium heckeshornense]
MLATAGVIAFGSGVAAASPPPMLVDDPAPAPAPDPTAAVNAANAIFGVLNSLLNSVLPGAGSLVPETSPASPLSPGTGTYPSPLSPGVGTYPGMPSPGVGTYPGPLSPAQAPTAPPQTGPLSPAQTSPVV